MDPRSISACALLSRSDCGSSAVRVRIALPGCSTYLCDVFVSENHTQADATAFSLSLLTARTSPEKILAILLDTPQLMAFIYVKYVSPTTGFGLFSGEDIPYKDTNFTRVCLGTYGGMVCGGEREALSSKAMYNMTNGHLTRDPEPHRPRLIERMQPKDRRDFATER